MRKYHKWNNKWILLSPFLSLKKDKSINKNKNWFSLNQMCLKYLGKRSVHGIIYISNYVRVDEAYASLRFICNTFSA